MSPMKRRRVPPLPMGPNGKQLRPRPVKDDDSSQELPRLEDTHTAGSARTDKRRDGPNQSQEGGSRADRGSVAEVEWQEGDPPSWLKFDTRSLPSAYNRLNIDSARGDEEVFEALSSRMRTVEAGPERSTGEEAGAILLVACARSEATAAGFRSLALRLYVLEANALLRQVRLPLPRGTKPGDPFIIQSSPSSESTAATDNSSGSRKSRLQKAEEDAKTLRRENDELKASVAAFKADIKEAFQARDAKETERNALQASFDLLRGIGLRSNVTSVSKREEQDMRRRRPGAQPEPVADVPTEPAASPKGKPSVPSRRRSPKLRQLAFVLPCVLLALYLFSKSTSPRRIGNEYAVCTRALDGIITMDERSPSSLRTQCIVVKHNKVAGLGTLDEIRERWGDRDTVGNDGIRIIFLRKDDTILPGLIDAHAHVLQFGEAQTSVNLVGSTSIEEVRDRIAQFIKASPALQADKSQFILGLGWDQTKFTDVSDGAFPTAADLDADPRLRGRPITLKRVDVHALWVSEAILDLLPASLPESIPGGFIIRRDVKPTGVFLDNAMSLVTSVVPPWTDQRRLEYLRATSREMLKHGLTSVHDAALTLSDVAFLRKIDKDDMLPIRIWGMLSCENPLNSFCGDDERAQIYEGNKFDLRAVKLFIDGALGSWGSAMHEPYSDKPESKGILICGREELNEVVRKWVERGYQVNSHGIGDLANTLILEAYDRVLSNASLPSYSATSGRESAHWTSRNPLRLRIEHAQILRVSDIEWMGRLGVVASFQPTHATSDMPYVETRIGKERTEGAYAWRKILSSGAPYALGSDFPVESVDPFLGLYAAITRKYSPGSSKTGSPHGAHRGWYEEEAMTPLEALRGFTSSAAMAGFQEDRVGILREGMEADFIVVRDGDVLKLGEKRAGESDQETSERERRLGTMAARVKATVVGGRVMYGRLT
ncbi:hypothetical protein JCM3766R1_005265 [Sporobolomyces carnicolor]